MEQARRILGQEWLGFVDSGLPEGDPVPPLPEGCFARLIILAYDENGGYPHGLHACAPVLGVTWQSPHPDQIVCHQAPSG
jgi:hypothetical protein